MMNVVRSVRRGDVSSVYPMIKDKAIKAWRRLPDHTKAWVTVDDLIQDGIAFTVTKVAKHFDPHRETKFSTYLFVVLDNYYSYRIEPYFAQERDEKGTYSFDRDYVRRDGQAGLEPIADYLEARHVIQHPDEKIICGLDVQTQFLRIYADASKELRQYLVRWFFQPLRSPRMAPCRKLSAAKKEFRSLCAKHSFTIEMCRELMQVQALRLRVAAVILARFRTIKRRKKNGTCAVVEEQLCQLQTLNA